MLCLTILLLQQAALLDRENCKNVCRDICTAPAITARPRRQVPWRLSFSALCRQADFMIVNVDELAGAADTVEAAAALGRFWIYRSTPLGTLQPPVPSYCFGALP